MPINEETISSSFVISYRTKIVKFKPKVLNRRIMTLKEFAMTILGIEPLSTEIIAFYIGKLGFDTYNKGKYEITITKKTRHGIKGKITYDEKTYK